MSEFLVHYHQKAMKISLVGKKHMLLSAEAKKSRFRTFDELTILPFAAKSDGSVKGS